MIKFRSYAYLHYMTLCKYYKIYDIIFHVTHYKYIKTINILTLNKHYYQSFRKIKILLQLKLNYQKFLEI